ncbi:MAG: DUF1446 domain-containing protein [Anaerolineae bacterium]|jgi:hypothetical protein
MKTVRLGNGSAYWGDMLDPAVDVAAKGDIDYLGLDHLAELTLAILQRYKNKNPEFGYIPDLIPWTKALLPITIDRGITMITNAGGANPEEGGRKAIALARDMGFKGLKVATVSGDDVLDKLPDLEAKGVPFVNMDTGEEGLDRIRDNIVAANAYIGSEGILEALQAGAEYIIAGRISDGAPFVAALMHEFGWSFEDGNWDKIGAGITIGHLLECACFCTGGGSNQWREAVDAWKIGFPIAEVNEIPEAIITKAPDTGGIVNQWTVKEQLLYEVLDPHNYYMPDGIADLGEVTVEEVGENRVEVKGFRGKPRPDTLKLCIGYQDGWIAEGLLLFSWPDALAKAQRAEEIVRKRLKHRVQVEPEEIRFDYVGVNALHQHTAPMPDCELNEVGLRIAAKLRTREEADLVRREATHLWTLGGIGTAFGVPFPLRPVVSLWPTLVPRDAIETKVTVETV